MTEALLLAVSPDISPDHWIYVGFPIFVYLTISFSLFLVGSHGTLRNPVRIFFRRISTALEQGTGYPGWAMAGVLSGLVMLAEAAMGLYWDVAWHFDLGRDRQLFTPSHTMIVVGLGGLIWAAGIAVLFATNDRAEVGLRVGGLRIPWSAVSLAALGVGGLAAFPLDALWHEAYGIDVTLWSPTHLMLVAGGSWATISLWLMVAEARKGAAPTWLGRVIVALVAGATLTGLSTFQGEFDFGLPQFQLLYWPLLVVVAAGFGLVAARIGLGRGGALQAVVAYLVIRTTISLLVGTALNHTFPRLPLYVAAAVAVEVVAWIVGTRRPVAFAVAAGLAVATVGLAGEVLWSVATGWATSSPPLLAKVVLLAPVAGVAAALLGAGLARALSGASVPGAALGIAGLVLVSVLAVPLPRKVGDVDAVIRLHPVGERATVEVHLSPPDAARGATAFGVASWQGGGTERAELERVGPGHYVTSEPVPVTGSWKTVVGLARGDQVMAAPVYLPADPEIGAPAVPALPERQTSFERNTSVLLREQRPGPIWPAVVAYGGLVLVVAGWVALLALVVAKVAPARQDPTAQRAARQPSPRQRSAPLSADRDDVVRAAH